MLVKHVGGVILYKILFLHQNFPAQFTHLAPALAAQGHRVLALTAKSHPVDLPGVETRRYTLSRGTSPDAHPWITDCEAKTIRAEAVLQMCRTLKAEGFHPDVIIAHPGWGESLFVKEVWPEARLGLYCELFYRFEGQDTGFDPEFPVADDLTARARLKLKNLTTYLHDELADAAISPTHWQAASYPDRMRDKISVIHDGIDTDAIRPDLNASITLRQRSGNAPIRLTRQDQIVTFVARNLEPLRGFHVFMRALPELLQRNPDARIIIVGSSDGGYGKRPTVEDQGHTTWRDVFVDEVRPRIPDKDWERVHFVGRVDRKTFTSLLQVSSAHVYLTYPFVLSWSLLEAMSVGAPIVASNTAPVAEVLRSDENALLVDFFATDALVDGVSELLDNAEVGQALGAEARNTVVQDYELKRVCLPRQLEWVQGLMGATTAPGTALEIFKTPSWALR